MRRIDGSVDFSQKWTGYRDGFGNYAAGGEFWLGLEKIHQMTTGATYRLRVEFETSVTESWYSADYSSFVVDSKATAYKLHIGGYSGDAVDSFSRYDGMVFSIVNPSCTDSILAILGIGCSVCSSSASPVGPGHWYSRCHSHCLTCPFNTDSYFWSRSGLTLGRRLKSSSMMIKTQ